METPARHIPCPPPEVLQFAAGCGLSDAETDWRPLAGGQTNQLWSVPSNTGPVVVKLFLPERDTPLFPNTPADEARMLAALAPSGLAPRKLHFGRTTLGEVLIYAQDAGQPWTQDTARAARLLRRVHDHPAPDGLRPVPGGSDWVTAQVQSMWSGLPGSLKRWLGDHRPTQPVASTSHPVLLHGDPVAGNILSSYRGDLLIDWQCPGVGDAVEDLTLFLSPAMQQIYRGTPLTDAEHDAFLIALSDRALIARLQAMAPWHHWRMAAYCGWKAARGSADYHAAMPLEQKALLRLSTP